MQFLAFDGWVELAVAALSVILVGLSKGGLGGTTAILAVPVMSLVVPPVQAAGILLPILLVMDSVSLWTWWGKWRLDILRSLLPWACLGVGIGWATAAFVSDGMVRLIVGAVALGFVVRWWSQKETRSTPRNPGRISAGFWGTVSGYTSFVAHAGGPPYQVHTVPMRMEPAVYAATSVLFFAIINAVKVVPYLALGQFDATNLTTSAAMFPLAIVSTLAGAAIVRRVRAEAFYPFMYAMIFLIGVKLVWDGAWAIL